MNVQVLINKFSCAKEVYKIAIRRWRIAIHYLLALILVLLDHVHVPDEILLNSLTPTASPS